MMKERQLQNAGRVNIPDSRYILEWLEKTYVCNSSAQGEEKWACDVTYVVRLDLAEHDWFGK
jgi:hypothetical protein